MKHLLKSWLPPESGTRKYLSSNLAHRISRTIDRRIYEVVLEGYIDLHDLDSEQPDIIVYDKANQMKPVLIIEFCDQENSEETQRTIEIISRIFDIRESFVFNMDTRKWTKVTNQFPAPEESSYCVLVQNDLNSMLHQDGAVSKAVA